MTLRLWLLLAALFCFLALASVDAGWPFDVSGDQHLPMWLGLGLFFSHLRKAER